MTTLAETLDNVRVLWEGHMAQAIDRAERQAVIAALDAAGLAGTAKAAEALGISRDDVAALIRKHRLRPKWEE